MDIDFGEFLMPVLGGTLLMIVVAFIVTVCGLLAYGIFSFVQWLIT